MANITVKGGDLARQIKQLTDACDAEIKAATVEAGRVASADVVRQLKATSPRRKGAAYAKSWKVRKEGLDTYIVYNEKHYRLTHLLEKGHDIIRNGRKVGRAKAYPHIKQAEQKGIEEYINKTIEEVNRRLGQ